MREVPPTAGMPLQWDDFIPRTGIAFEHELAAFLNVPAVQIECSGTAALVVALTALRQGSARRSVVLPAYTCPLVALAVLHCGLKPVLCDLRPGHFDLEPQALERACNDDTLAIIPTHLGGRVADLAPVLQAARSVGAHVVEDAAQALGAYWNGSPVGMAGDAGFYSLAVGKGLTLYEGGVMVARDAALRQRLRDCAAAAVPSKWGWELRRILELLGYAALYRSWSLPLAYGLPLRRALKRGKLIEAVGDDFTDDIPLHRVGRWRKTVGANALKRLPDFLAILRRQATQRLPRLAAIPGIKVMADAPQGQGAWPFFMVLMPSIQARDTALATLWGSGLGVSRLYIHALPDYPYLAGRLGFGAIPNARDFAARMLTVSNSPWLDDYGFERICRILEKGTQ